MIERKALVDCVRDGSKHVAKRSKAYSPTSAKRLESNIDKKTIELASLTRARPHFFINFYFPIVYFVVDILPKNQILH